MTSDTTVDEGRPETWLAAVTEGLAATILAAMLALTAAAVVARYIFGVAFAALDEIVLLLFIALVACGIPLSVSGAATLRLTILVDRLPLSGRRAAGMLADAVVVAAALMLAIGGWRAAGAVGGVSPLLGVPEGLRFLLVAAGGAATLAALVSARCRREALVAIGAGGALYLIVTRADLTVMATPSLIAATVALLTALLGAPLPFALLAGAAATLPVGGLLPEAGIVQQATAGAGKILLIAIPFFLLAGEVMTRGGLAERLMRFAAALVGHRRGGMAQTALLTSALFSGASGSSIANAAFGAKVMAPALVARGHRPEEAGAIVASVAVLDNVIPPSIAFLILAAAANLSVGSLLVGGFVAGAVLVAALALGLAAGARHQDVAVPKSSAAERRGTFAAALPTIGLGVVVVLGIRFGIVTVTEASALAALYALAACLILRSLGRQSLIGAFRRAGADAAVVGVLIAASAPFTFLLAVDQVPAALTRAAMVALTEPLLMLIAANVLLLAVGCLLDIGAAILLFGPLLVPVAVAAGIDPVAFGVLMIVNLMIGGITPPVGILVYVVAGAMRLPPGSVFRAALPLTLWLVGALAVMSVAVAIAARL